MRLPLSSVALIVTIFAKNVVNTSLANSSSSQSTPTGLCNKPPVNNCNCQCRLAQNSQLSNAVKALEKKLENLTQNSQLSDTIKALEKKLENLTQNSQLSDAMKGLEKKLENLIALVNKSSFDVPKPFPPADAIISSCKEQYERDKSSCQTPAVTVLDLCTTLVSFQNKYHYFQNSSSRSQVYNLTTGNQQIPVYCHMGKFGNFGCGDGGWTMVMKMDSVKRTFHYNSNLWSNMNAYNPAGGQSGFDKQETKLPTYWHTPFSTICLGMRIGTQLNLAVINRQATSLSSLIADGSYRATSLNRTSWKSLIGSAGSLQTCCNRQGFNVASERAYHAKVRIGIIANNENDCKTSDSRIGFGGGGVPDDSNTCGNAARLNTDNGDKFIHAMGYILVQ